MTPKDEPTRRVDAELMKLEKWIKELEQSETLKDKLIIEKDDSIKNLTQKLDLTQQELWIRETEV